MTETLKFYPCQMCKDKLNSPPPFDEMFPEPSPEPHPSNDHIRHIYYKVTSEGEGYIGGHVKQPDGGPPKVISLAAIFCKDCLSTYQKLQEQQTDFANPYTREERDKMFSEGKKGFPVGRIGVEPPIEIIYN
jgi:hypothetical protein